MHQQCYNNLNGYHSRPSTLKKTLCQQGLNSHVFLIKWRNVGMSFQRKNVMKLAQIQCQCWFGFILFMYCRSNWTSTLRLLLFFPTKLYKVADKKNWTNSLVCFMTFSLVTVRFFIFSCWKMYNDTILGKREVNAA